MDQKAIKIKKNKDFVLRSKLRMRIKDSLISKGPTFEERFRSQARYHLLFKLGSRFSNQVYQLKARDTLKLYFTDII